MLFTFFPYLSSILYPVYSGLAKMCDTFRVSAVTILLFLVLHFAYALCATTYFLEKFLSGHRITSMEYGGAGMVSLFMFLLSIGALVIVGLITVIIDFVLIANRKIKPTEATLSPFGTTMVKILPVLAGLVLCFYLMLMVLPPLLF